MKARKMGLGLIILIAASWVQAQPGDFDRERNRNDREHPERSYHDERQDKNAGRQNREQNREHRYDRAEDSRNSAWFNADYRWGGYKRYVTYNYHRHHHPQWAPRYGHRYNARYLFYEDLNIYYDCHRDLFILWTGRNWVTTSRVPKAMHRIDFNRTRVQGVDYWDDDFDRYLNRRRPVYINLNGGW